MRPGRPRDLVFTLFGEYLLERADAVWVGSLISLLQPFELSDGAIRTTLSRMATKGWLSGERTGRHSAYRLTDRGRRLLEEGQARIFHTEWANEWDGRWLLLAYSIPEDRRGSRDRLRDGLAWLGFGSLGNGLWISPHRVQAEVERLAGELGIEGHIEAFESRRVSGGSDAELVTKCWDLEELNRKYADFVRRWSRAAEGDPPAPLDGYVGRFRLIHEFRGFPLEDPYLPRPLLPESWNGREATRVFHAVHDRLAGPADRHVDAVLAESPLP